MKVLYVVSRPRPLARRFSVAALVLAALLPLGCTPICMSDADCPSGDQCSNGACVPKVVGGGGDTTPPAAAVSSPDASATVHGTVSINVTASDNIGVSAVDIDVDGTLVQTLSAPPYALAWNTTGLPNGAHSITATAHDAAGNTGNAPAVSVTVQNGAGISPHTLLGFPGPATPDGTDVDHYLSVKSQYVVSYNGTRREPNWVSWQLVASWLGPAPRQNDFRVDPSFPSNIPQAALADYAGSGYDRGHMCPSEDRTDTIPDNQATFFLTNMIPQLDNVNGGPWSQLESYSRSLASSGKGVYVTSGGVYAGTATIGNDHVAVPSASWKVITVLDAATSTIADLSGSTRVIAVVMPNDGTVSKSADWHTFRVTPATIESETGLTFFADAPPAIRSALDAELDTAP